MISPFYFDESQVWPLLEEDCGIVKPSDEEISRILASSTAVDAAHGERSTEADEEDTVEKFESATNVSNFYERMKEMKRKRIEAEARVRAERLAAEAAARAERERLKHAREEQIALEKERVKQAHIAAERAAKFKPSNVPFAAPQSLLGLGSAACEDNVVDLNTVTHETPLPAAPGKADFDKQVEGERHSSVEPVPAKIQPVETPSFNASSEHARSDGVKSTAVSNPTPPSDDRDACPHSAEKEERKAVAIHAEGSTDVAENPLPAASEETRKSLSPAGTHSGDIHPSSVAVPATSPFPSDSESVSATKGTGTKDAIFSGNNGDAFGAGESSASFAPFSHQGRGTVPSDSQGIRNMSGSGKGMGLGSMHRHLPFTFPPLGLSDLCVARPPPRVTPGHVHDNAGMRDEDCNVMEMTQHYAEVLESLLQEEQREKDGVSDDDDDASTIASIANLSHGRIGELVAADVLQKEFGAEGVQITWLNESDEAFRPYDFLVESEVPSQPRRRFVEVKTRVSDREQISQWFISASELVRAVDVARETEAVYSCLLIHLERTPSGYELRKMYFVDNLMAVEQDRLKFIVHLSV